MNTNQEDEASSGRLLRRTEAARYVTDTYGIYSVFSKDIGEVGLHKL